MTPASEGTSTAIGRRAALRWFAVSASGLVLAACAAEPAARPRPTPTPMPTRTPTPTAGAAVGSGTPTTQASYGPNGTHYPENLPWLGDTSTHEFVAECNWSSIGQILEELTDEEVAAGAVIRVKPGELPGNGSGSNAGPVLQNVGNETWSRNVLICPRDGFGSVTVSAGGIRIDQCANLALFGFLSTGSCVLTLCTNMLMGWSKWGGLNVTRGVKGMGFYELVLGFRRDETDTAGVRPTDAYEMTDIQRHGCLFGPSVKPAGSGAHCDTIQMEGTGNGPFGPLTSVDCVDFGSSNAAELLHTAVTYAEYRNCLILAGTLPWTVYPLAPGDYEGEPNAFAGGCMDVRLTDTIVAGAVGRMGFTQVHNSTLSYPPQDAQQPSVSGSWQVDASIAGWDAAKIMSLQTLDDYEPSSFTALWTW